MHSMYLPSSISLQDGEEIIWQGQAQLPAQRWSEYIPLLILIVLLVNSFRILYPTEPLIMLHDFCSYSFIPGLLIIFTVAFAVAPTLKRKLLSRQIYLFTNHRAISYSSGTGNIIHTLPAEHIPDCIIKRHGADHISILKREQTGTESSTTLLFAHIPAVILSHYTPIDETCTCVGNEPIC